MDVFPPGNLPGSSENWGRTVEGRIIGVEQNLVSLSQEQQAQNRNTASSLQLLSEQVIDLDGVASDLAETQVEIEQVQAAIPTAAVLSASGSNFASGSTYGTRATLTVPGVPGKSATIMVTGEAGIEETDALGDPVDTRVRVLVGGVSSPSVLLGFAGYGLNPGGGMSHSGSVTYSVTRPVGGSTVINLQTSSSVPARTPARAANYANLYTIVVYS